MKILLLPRETDGFKELLISTYGNQSLNYEESNSKLYHY